MKKQIIKYVKENYQAILCGILTAMITIACTTMCISMVKTHSKLTKTTEYQAAMKIESCLEMVENDFHNHSWTAMREHIDELPQTESVVLTSNILAGKESYDGPKNALNSPVNWEEVLNTVGYTDSIMYLNGYSTALVPIVCITILIAVCSIGFVIGLLRDLKYYKNS